MIILPLKCLLVGILLMLLFYFCSILAEKLLGIEMTLFSERLLFGFFLYFLLFEIVSVPLILLQQPFHVLCAVWTMLIVVIAAAALFFLFRKGAGRIGFFSEDISAWDVVLGLGAFGLVSMVTVLSVFHKYIGWDPSYYLGTMNTTLATDTMYLFDGADGTPEDVINLRYALSAFYMQFTYWCNMFQIPVRIAAWWLVRPLCSILSALIVYLIGMELTEKSSGKAFGFVILWVCVLLFWSDIHTTAYFMIIRGYEAKGYCSNVVIPMFLYGILCLFRKWQKGDRKKELMAWRKLALIAFSSVAISMSAMALVPMGLAVMGTTMLLVEPKRWADTMKKVLFCALPNLLVVMIYLLHAKDVLVVPVHLP